MKKQTKLDLSNNTLKLRKEVIRVLQPQDLDKVAGGRIPPTWLPGKHC